MKSGYLSALLGFAGIATLASTPAGSAPLIQDSRLAPSVASNVENVQWRERHYWRGHRHWGPGYHRPYYRRHYSWGPAVGGLAAGAIIGSVIANSRAQADAAEIAYCSRRFKSYDPASGTYLGYDGERHPCP